MLSGLISVIAVTLLCCIQISVCSLGAECERTDNCAVDNSFCNNSVCQCSDGYYQQNTTTCLPKIGYNMTCRKHDVCLDSHAVCRRKSKCYCIKKYFWSSSSSVCKPMTDLKVKGISFTNTNRENTTVTWQQDGELSVISRYRISWTPGNGTETESNTSRESLITKLKAATEYTVTVTTVVNDNTKTKRINETATVTTIQALKGTCTNTTQCGRQYFAECFAGRFCRCISGRYRNIDGECHLVEELGVSSFSYSQDSPWSEKFSWMSSTKLSKAPDMSITYQVTVNPGHFSKKTSGNSVTVQNLKAGKKYSAQFITMFQQDEKTEIVNNETVEFTTQKIPNNRRCKVGDVCSDSNAFCSSTNPTRCLCNEGYFWGPTPLLCTPVSDIRPNIINLSRTNTTSLRVSWSPSQVYSNLVMKYDVVWTPVDKGSSTVYENNTADITGLTPGQLYTVVVRAFTNQTKKEQSVSSSSLSQRTFPDTPGPFDEEKSNLTAPNITLYFKKSEGRVDYYTVNLTGDSDSYNQTQNLTSSAEKDPKVVFSDITPGNYYTLSITAVSYGDHSETYIYSGIRGSVKPPDKVKSLSVSDITYSSIFVSWNRPDNPNGVIFAYILTLQQISNETCQQKVVFYCSDCTSMNNVDSDMHCEGVTPVKVNINSSVLNDAGEEFSYNLTHLLPFTYYTVSVFTYNELDSGPASKMYQMTESKSAAPPDNFRVVEITSSSITVTWSPESPKPGTTDYNLIVSEKAENGKSDKIIKNEIIKGWSSNQYIAQHLSSYWDYMFQLTANTSAGKSQPVWIDYIKTKQSAPTPPVNFEVRHIDNNYTDVMVTYDCPKQKDGRNGIITSSFLVYNTTMKNDDVITNSISIENTNNCHFSISVPVTVEINYNFYVRLKTVYDGETAATSFYTPPGPPVLESVIRKPSEETLYERQFVMMVHPRSVYKNVAGHVKLAGIIVFRQDVYTADYQSLISLKRRFRRNTHSTDYYSSYTNWYISNVTDFKLPYRATNDSWINKDLEVEKYVVGSMNCSTQKHSFCNGPLKSGTKYISVLFACTDAGCQESAGIQFKTKAAESEKETQVSSAVIAFSVVTVILFLLLVVVSGAFFWYVRRHRAKQEFSKRNNDSQNDQYKMTSGQSNVQGCQVGNLSTREVSGGDTQQIETSTFGNDYVNVRQAAAGGNEYERMSPAASSENIYSKIT